MTRGICRTPAAFRLSQNTPSLVPAFPIVAKQTSSPPRGFSRGGEEVCFATIGNAGTSEGVFWESLNAAGVLQIPLVISVWDDGYGISVPNEFQTTKGSISAVLEGFRRQQGGTGLDLYTVKGHDYVACCDVYQLAVESALGDPITS